MHQQFVALLLLIQFVTSSWGLKCFVCNSARDPRCGDPFDPRTIELVDCEQYAPGKNATLCRKVTQRVSMGARADLRVIRTCGWELDTRWEEDEVEEEEDSDGGDDTVVRVRQGRQHRCYNRAGTFEVMVTYCSCGHEECNKAAPTLVLHSFLLLLVIPFTFLLPLKEL